MHHQAEYIAVHRSGGRRHIYTGRATSGSSGSGDGVFWLILLGGLGVWFFWDFFVSLLLLCLSVGAMFLVGYLVWRFRAEIWKGAIVASRYLLRGLKWTATNSGTLLCKTKQLLVKLWEERNPFARKAGNLSSSSAKPKNYGKIIQQRNG